MTLQKQESFGHLSGPDLDERSFQRIAEFAYETAGLSIAPTKSAMVRTRLARRLRALKITSFGAYCDYFQSVDGTHERTELISALTTNVSHFFRENHHFELVRENLLPELAKRDQTTEPVRFWSAGCSNGQEPLSIAMTINECGVANRLKNIKILATDIDPKVIDYARRFEYPQRMLEGLSVDKRSEYFDRLASNTSDPIWSAKERLRNLITYRQLNLLGAWPMKGKFDAVFCRNVVIYFDQSTQDQLWEKFIDILRPGGWLFLGHSERISEKYLPHFETQGSTAYRLIR
ncbi:CheR family methyltransferase [Aliiroseovarius crassostreae]|uniref:CheR family methyltransferase n=1 Tax=Aliiroseovarius crassostreae TaxID=154981 RepID=UPI003C7B7C52